MGNSQNNNNNDTDVKMVKIKKNISQKYQFIEQDEKDKLSKLGSTVRNKRQALKISASKFSQMMGISRPTLQSLEEGIPNISLHSYLKAFKLLGLSLKIEIVQNENVKK